jgi:hypothetical protein
MKTGVFKKRVKKLKFEKRVPAWNISKNGCLPPAGGRGHPAQPEGGMFQKVFCMPLPRTPLRIRKFLIREEIPKAGIPPDQRAGSIPPGQWAGC